LSANQDSLAQVLVSFLQHQFRLKRGHLQFVRVFYTQMFAGPSRCTHISSNCRRSSTPL
jgi:hypothetical protein